MNFLRRQFDKVLLIGMILFLSMLLMHLHSDHPSAEIRELVQFFREITAGFVGCFLGLIQGHIREHKGEEEKP